MDVEKKDKEIIFFTKCVVELKHLDWMDVKK